ncbi:MAG: hypothetical protein IJL23_04135 [Alphaproteobacteria bacterium]|nr:hypothetical protein [Alphaproteobacteria bacterium]
MKKLLNISVIAALAVLPLAATAAVTDADPGATNANAPVATNLPKYSLAQAGDNDGNVATAGYVKGAYNAAIKAINKVSETAGNAANQDLTNLSATGKANVSAQGTVDTSGSTTYGAGTVGAAINAIKTTADGAVQNVSEGSTNGTVSVDGTDVAVHGLGSAAYSATTDYISSTAGSVKTANIDNGQVTKEKLAQAVQDSLDAADSALQAGDNISELVNDAGYLTSTDLGDYATKTGVAATVNAATGSVTGVNLTVAGTPTGTVSSALSNGSVTASVNMPTSGTVATLTTWGNDNSTGTTDVTLATTATNISGTVTGDVTSTFTGTGIDSGTATGNITGIDVSVSDYQPGA